MERWTFQDYDEIYRAMHPRKFPYSPWEPQRELRDLWPEDQAKFRKMVDAINRVRDRPL